MDTFNGNWTGKEKETINRALDLHKGKNTANPWHFYKHGNFSAQRQSWDFGGLRSDTADELSCKIQAYYTRK